ncbi:MAG: pentapeptide repeat-containing protein [Anaerolineae bacterium]|jgi:uncharacterized protein YjbI with pentapeptide repeats|nr:pentapeptide repeat-containing protein [Anaerolineae bacterium]
MKKWWQNLPTENKVVIIIVSICLAIFLGGAFIYEIKDIVTAQEYRPEQIVLVKPPDPSIRDLLWRVTELLIIPATLVIIVSLINQRQQEQERGRREQAEYLANIRTEETTLQNYIDRMTELLLQHNLRGSEPDDEIRDIARTRTLTALRRLTEERRSSVVRFLYGARLINADRSLVDLQQADLRKVRFRKSQLQGIDFHKVRLSGSNLSGADLSQANLTEATLHKFIVEDEEGNVIEEQPTRMIKTDLSEATLVKADLRGSSLRRANLQRADLSEALLNEAILDGTDLRNARLTEAKLDGALLVGADLTDADLANTSLAGATYDSSTKWPDGFDPVVSGANPMVHD